MSWVSTPWTLHVAPANTIINQHNLHNFTATQSRMWMLQHGVQCQLSCISTI